jgi:hypothetical protein
VKATAGVTMTRDRLPDVLRAVRALERNQVLVGIPPAKVDREGADEGPITNAAIGYINEFGSPAQNIPARPHLIPGVREAEKRIVARLRAAGDSALRGSETAIMRQLTAIGLVAQNSVRAKVTLGPFAPLSPRTLEARARRGRQGAARALAALEAGKPPDAADARPLIDTGEYRRSITFVIRPKGR